MALAMEANFVRALKKPEQSRDKEALDTIYWFLHSMEVLSCLREPALRSICRSVRYQYSAANDVLYSAGDKATCWYILLSGSVFIEGSMFLPRQSFGKRTAGCARRVNECLTLEASEMIVIDYPDVTLMTQPQTSVHHHHHHHIKRKYNAHNSHNIERLLAATAISNHDTKVVPPTVCHTRCKSDSSVQQLPVELQGVHNMLQKSEQLLMLRSDTTTSLPTTTSVGTPTKRHSRASDTSSAYSGSDMTTQSLSVAGDDADIDLSCLRESSVDSDDDENLDTTESLIVRDTVRECLEKDPGERTEDDIEVLLDFLQHLLAFANMTLATRRALCAVMVFAVVDKAGTIVMKDGEELDSWSVILNGHVEVMRPDGTIEHLHMGDSFGITPTMEKLYHSGVMRTKVDDCQFVCIAQSDYYNILHQGEENTRRHKEGDEVVLVTEHRVLDGGNRKGYIVIRGTVDRLINHLVEQHSAVDPTYVEDFLLTHRAFLKSPLLVAEKLLVWFSDPKLRDRVTRVVLLWVNNHFNDFEMHSEMTDFLEKFEYLLKKEHMGGQLRLLNIACAAKARVRTVVVTRITRQEILHFSVLGGLERGCGIFISNVEPGSKALEAGLKRGDQILEVNNHNFEHISHHCALEVLRGTTHLSINVKSNLLAFNEKLVTPDNSPGHRRKREQIAKLQNDPRQRLSASDLDKVSIVPPFINTPGRGGVEKKERRFMSTGHKAKIRKALMRMNLLPRSGSSDSQLTNYDETSMSSSSSLSTQYYKRSISANSSPLHTPHLSASNPDLTSLGQYTDSGSSQPDYPEHVLKVYRADQSCKYFLVHRETTAHEVVMLVLNEFGITDPSSNYSLCEVSVEQGGVIKQKRLPDQLANLPDRIGLSSRYYLKNNMTTDTLVPDDLAGEMLKEGQVSLLQLNAAELAAQLTLRDFHYFHEIEPTEYIDDLFGLNSDYGAPKLATFSKFVNQEMFWVVSEVCRETNVMKRVKIIKNFIRCARHCKECKNFNSMFAIVSGLGHGSVSRLRSTWDKVPTKYAKMFTDLQDLMDPSRNMSNYRNLVNSEMVQPPLIPFFPVVKKDLTFIHLGNDSKVDGLINFEKLRMIAKEVRHVCAMASVQYDAHNMFLSYNTSQNMFFGGMTTLRRKRRNSAAPNPKKMHEEAQMVRQVRAYLVKVNIIDDETELNKMSQVCETASGGARKRDPSPSVSNGLDDRRYMHLGPKFGGARSVKSKQPSVITIQKTLLGAESPDAVRKLMSLSDKVRPHNSKQNPLPPTSHVPVLRANTVPVVGGRMAPVSPRQLRVPAVPLTAESSSVGSFAFRKPHNSGSVCSNDSHQSQQSLHSPTTETTFQLGHYDTDSGHNSIVSSNYDSHSSSSVGSTSSPPIEKRPPAIMVAPNMVAVTTVTSSSASTTVSHCQVRSSAVQSVAGTPPSSPHSQSRSYCDPQCPSTSSVARPPLPPYHVIVQNNPAYSEYIQQHYPVLNEHPVDYPSERPPLPDYHTATTMAAHRMPPSHQPLHHARSRSYDPTYFEPDLVDDYDDAEEQVSAV